MLRTPLATLVVLIAHSSVALSQPADTAVGEHHGTSILFEAAIGVRLDRRPDPSADDDRGYASWDIGPLFNHGGWAWGATLMAATDQAGGLWGIRPRYRRWLGPRAAFDISAGILLGDLTSNDEKHYPAFTGMLGLCYGNWLGVNLEFRAISTEYYLPAPEWGVPATKRSSFDWVWAIGARTSGPGAIALTAAEGILVLIALASFSEGWD